jgi:hypothetical protein
MKKRLLAGLVGAFLVGGVAFAAPADAKVSGPGVPGTSSCVGQTTAYVAQGGAVDGYVSANGIGNFAKANHLTVAQVHAGIQFYCATGSVPLG